MSDRERRIRVDWQQVKAAGKDLEARAETLELEREDLEEQLEPLRLSVEEGIIEYKRGLLAPVFRQLDDARYRSLSTTSIAALAKKLGVFVYIAMLQKLIADGVYPPRDRQAKIDGTNEQPETDVKEIIAEIQERVKNEPGLKTRQPAKNILMQLSRYSRELESFKEFTTRAPKEQATAAAANFRVTTEEIFTSIRRNYDQLLADGKSAIKTEPGNILLTVDLKSLSALYASQAEQASAIRSVVEFAREEQYGTRELLIEMADKKESLDQLIRNESEKYRALGLREERAREIARSFVAEISRRVEREIEYY